jgi:hypothetical protein
MICYDATKLGTVTVKQNGQKYNVDIRSGNCLAVFVYIRKATPEELEIDPNGKYCHMLYSFFADEKHCKNMMKDYGTVLGDDVVSIKLNMAYKQSWTMLKYFVKSGYKVTCYEKSEKKNKK